MRAAQAVVVEDGLIRCLDQTEKPQRSLTIVRLLCGFHAMRQAL